MTFLSQFALIVIVIVGIFTIVDNLWKFLVFILKELKQARKVKK